MIFPTVAAPLVLTYMAADQGVGRLTSSVWNLIFKPPDINASGKKIYPANEIWQNLRKILAITSGDVTFYNIADTAALGAPETWNFPFLDVWI